MPAKYKLLDCTIESTFTRDFFKGKMVFYFYFFLKDTWLNSENFMSLVKLNNAIHNEWLQ